MMNNIPAQSRSSAASISLGPKSTVFQALELMERKPKDDHPAGLVLVVDEGNCLLGVVTDGDIRRALLAGKALTETVESIMTRDPITVSADDVEGGSYSALLQHVHRSRRMLDSSAAKVVVVDSEQRVVDVVALSDVLKQQSVKSQTLCVIGLGYVGLTLAVSCAEVGLTVYGVETNSDVRELLQSGKVHIYESDLERAFVAHLGKRLFVVSDVAEAKADIYLISVGTPIDNEGNPLMHDVEAASRAVSAVLKRGDLVALRSTVPIGTSRKVSLPILEQGSGLTGGQDFDFIFAPERTVAGNALRELRSLPQVIGSLNPSGLERALALFRELTASVVTVESLEEAEAVKLLNNTYRDHVFAFANEVALIGARWGLDIARVIRAANQGYPRNPIPMPSPGVGGVCLRKDPYLLLASARAVDYEPHLIGQSRRVNESMPQYVAEHILKFFEANGKLAQDAKIFIAGFAFKGDHDTSDMRDSPTLALVSLLQSKVGSILGYDAVVPSEQVASIPGVKGCTIQEGFENADCVVLMNNHRSFLQWKVNDLLLTTRRPVLFFDGWRLFEPSDICKVEGVSYGAMGIEYVSDGNLTRAVMAPTSELVEEGV